MNDMIEMNAHTALAGLMIDDLAPNGCELSEDEVRAVSGGLYNKVPSWTSGSGGKTDEWTIG